jgi:hypothetical protein
MNNASMFRLGSVNWRWLVVTYCFLILFHYFSSFLVSGMNLFFRYPLALIFLWLCGGIVIVCAYVGFWSVGTTIVEPGIASVLYVVSLFILLPNVWQGFYFRVIVTPWLAAFLILVFLAGCFGATLGEWLHLRKEKRQNVILKERSD